MMQDKNLIILIGAARSGTKAFRDLFKTHSYVSTIPYDINYIWQIGNENSEDDLILPNEVTDKNKEIITKFILKYFKENSILVEKTVSNTVRVPYLLSIFPNAKFIFLYREGIDVVESVNRQWDLKMDKTYLFDKLKHVPIKQLFTYGIKYLKRNTQKSVDYYWGVKTPSLLEDLKSTSRIEAIANQWKFCVDKMLEDRDKIKQENLIDVFYEDFVIDPSVTMEKIIRKFKLDIDPLLFRMSHIKSNNVGKSKDSLPQETQTNINNIIAKTQNNVFKLKISLKD